MSKSWIEKRIISEIVMFVEPNRIFIRCPYTHYSDCPASRGMLDNPLRLNVERTRNGLLITPQNSFTPRTRHMVASELSVICRECYLKKQERIKMFGPESLRVREK